MSHNFDLGLSFDSIDSSNKIYTKPLIKNLRHHSLHINVVDLCVKFHNWEFIIKQNIKLNIG